MSQERKGEDVSISSNVSYKSIPSEKAGPLTTLEFPLRMLGGSFLLRPILVRALTPRLRQFFCVSMGIAPIISSVSCLNTEK